MGDVLFEVVLPVLLVAVAGGIVGRRLAFSTFSGAVALAQSSPVDPSVLRAQVTSKGGTTERALGLLEAGAVKEKIIAAVRSAADRAGELGDAFGRDS